MRFTTLLGLAMAFSISGAPLLSGTAVAQTCQRGCGLQMKACIQTGRTTKLECKVDCRTNSASADVGSCIHGCVDTFRGTKDGCRSAVPDCVAACEPPPGGGGGGCLDLCGQDLGDCARNVATEAKACVRDCSAAPNRRSCLQDCAATAEGAAEICASNFASCRADCASPSGAFVD
jgi:hypothetical protein